MLKRLPGWVVDDVTSVRAEVAEWARMTPSERWHLAGLCAEDVLWAIHSKAARSLSPSPECRAAPRTST